VGPPEETPTTSGFSPFPGCPDCARGQTRGQTCHRIAALRIRVGLHTGDAVHENGDYVGITVNKAARVTTAAQPGETLLSSVTAEMADGRGFSPGQRYRVELRGLDGTHELTQLVGGPTST